MGDINKQILKARESLRKLHDKYLSEFHEIHLKIDNYLDKLQNNSGNITEDEDRKSKEAKEE